VSDLYRNLEARRSQIREVIGKSIGYIYAQFFFYSSRSLGKENVREPIANNQFWITVEPHESVVENLNTLSDIARLVISKKG